MAKKKISIENISSSIDKYYRETNQNFKMIHNKTDAILYYRYNEGVFYGMSITEIMQTKEGRKMLKWIMLTDTFPKRLRDLIKTHYEEYVDAKHRYDKYE